jgi:lipoprotein NlpD
LWPTNGRVISNFKPNDPARNGIEIAGEEGQPIVATAAGEVVYSGNGLIGYGELIIIKHSDRMLSAYAHNRQRLVAEGDRVSAGRKIAEMGRDERNKPVLHFEIRVNGNPGNPLNYLPPR